MRGSWGKKCLENYARRVVDRAETLDGVAAGREFGTWVANLLNVAEVSYIAVSQVCQANTCAGRVRPTSRACSPTKPNRPQHDLLHTPHTAHQPLLLDAVVLKWTDQAFAEQVHLPRARRVRKSVVATEPVGRRDLVALREEGERAQGRPSRPPCCMPEKLPRVLGGYPGSHCQQRWGDEHRVGGHHDYGESFAFNASRAWLIESRRCHMLSGSLKSGRLSPAR